MKTFSVSLLAIGMLFASMATLGSAAPLQPNDPSIAGSLDLWLAADQLGGLNTPGTPGAVSQWTDLSTNNNHATQATANLVPSLVNGVFGINAMPVVRFNETGTTWDYLDMPNFMDSPDVTAFVVGRAASAPKQNNYQAFFSDYGSSGSNLTRRLFMIQAFGTTTTTTGLRQLIRDGGGNVIGVPSSVSGSDTSQEFIAMARLDAPADTLTRRQMFADGTFVQDLPSNNSYDSNNTWQTSHAPRLGWLSGIGGGALDGDIAEVIVFGAALTPEQYAGVEAYLYEKYFVPEPGTGIMLVLAGMALALFRRRRSR